MSEQVLKSISEPVLKSILAPVLKSSQEPVLCLSVPAVCLGTAPRRRSLRYPGNPAAAPG